MDNQIKSQKISIAIMQPYFFPYIGYFQLINTVNKFIIYDDVNFIKKGWINRNNILLNGQKNMISIPLKKMTQNRLICDTKINSENNWIRKFSKSIEYGYKKSIYYDDVILIINKVLNCKFKYIKDLNLLSIKLVMEYLNIETEIIQTSSNYNNHNLSAQSRILDICIKESATHYINPMGGIELYDRKYFNNNGISLSFLKTNKIMYKQFKNEFISNLSIIDVMMFNSPSEIKSMLDDYKLI